jgi:hypothetical protein
MARQFFRGIEVEETSLPRGRKMRRHRGNTFVMIGRDQIVAIAKAFESPRLIVAWLVLYEFWANKGRSFTLSNAKLAPCGVSRYMKRCALREMQAAGLITVECKPGGAPVVTWLGPHAK